MKKSRSYSILLAAGLIAFIFSGCTSNPFGDDDIGAGARGMSGKVQLNDGSNPEGIYVWLETFNIGTRTDTNGEFKLTLPPPAAQGGGGGIDGAFSLYFYVANYQLATAQAVTRDGEFIFDQGDINAKGELRTAKSLKKMLRIETQVDPSPVPSNYSFRVGVQVTLQATIDTVTVVLPSVGGLLNTIFFRNVTSGALFKHESIINAPLESLLIGKEPRSRTMTFSINQVPGLTPGDYEIIPYLLVAHDAVPSELITSIAADANSPGPNYLKLPFRREGEQFKITNAE